MKRAMWRAGIFALMLAGSVISIGCGNDDNSTTVVFVGPDAVQTNSPQGGTYVLGRSFVTEDRNGVPIEAGFELTDDGINKQPPTPISDDMPNIYNIPLPPQFNSVTGATGTPYVQMMIFYFTGHPKDPVFRPNGEPQHFHMVLLVTPVQPPDPPTFANELAVPDPSEVPVGSPRGVPDTIVPGLGVSYDDPTKPVGQPPRVTIGQNFLFYQGHMHGMVVGEDVSFLQTRQTENDSVNQPHVYPKQGYFPFRWNVRYDPVRKVHIFSFSDFRFQTQAVTALAK